MKIADRYAAVINWFETNMPNPQSELNFTTPFEAIVAVMLSAQCTDERVNKTTPDLFKEYNTPEKMANADIKEIERIIHPCGFYKNKAKNALECSKMLVEKYGGEVPSRLEDLLELPGVGRKTANVILNVVYGEKTMPVDTHLLRISPRIGLSFGTTPESIEKDLLKIIPDEYMQHAHHWLILHGRYVCTARNPKCSECLIKDICQQNL